jgi:hypothetical protein
MNLSMTLVDDLWLRLASRQGESSLKLPARSGLLSGRPSVQVAERIIRQRCCNNADALDLIASRSWWSGGLWPMVPSPAFLVPINSR